MKEEKSTLFYPSIYSYLIAQNSVILRVLICVHRSLNNSVRNAKEKKYLRKKKNIFP